MPLIPAMWKEELDPESETDTETEVDPEPEPEIDFVPSLVLGRPDLRHQDRSPALADTHTSPPAKEIEAVQLDRGMVSLTS
jgi:hypothetical protein